ncbi:hypothetical protein [Actinacidiphila paucisporea]|uniref:Uncharacterized protein n=1 Tax=Actinacidiphila paucisporea TaxID=310782 RepID=A0A1M7PYS9_9ACTN|nr:hypothetical protein [Actinacidiphila paucisporea]SHN22915.1 hypothetical protein SAMN05216499_12753 [Actinacidiphila paucisporea]
MFPHPDFDLYDNTGRTTEQINAANTDAPTCDDLRHWSVKEGSVPDPVGPAITAWTDRLHAAEHSEVAQLLLLATTDPNGVLPRLHEFLEAAADKLQQAGASEAATQLTGIVTRLGELDQDLYDTAVDAWEDINTAQSRATTATSASPAVGARATTAAPPSNYEPAAPLPLPRPDHPHRR